MHGGIHSSIRAAILGMLTATYLVGFGVSLHWCPSVRDWMRDHDDGAGPCAACDDPAAASGGRAPPERCPECGASDWNMGEPPRWLRRLARASAVLHGTAAAVLLMACGVASVAFAVQLSSG